jgi:Pyridoxamine 5'-phosphate oxidase
MSKTFDSLDEALARFIRKQHMFFVATAPNSGDAHINLSPKGLDSFRILDPQTVAYLDLTGSGVETVAHLRENQRITLLFCAFEGPPKILRLYGQGEVLEPGDSRFEQLKPQFPDLVGARSIIVVTLTRIADSCGYAIPLYEYAGERTQLIEWGQRQGPKGLVKYRSGHNRVSIDGLAGLRSAASIDD